MSFLDELITPVEPDFDPRLLSQIDNLIWHSSLDEREKARLIKRMPRLETLEGAMQMINYLKQHQPIVGFHRAPMTQYEVVEAIRLRVERENFKERGKETNA